MPELTAIFRRVPRWAWYTSAGVGIAGVVLYTFQNRASEDAEPTTEETPTGVPDAYAPSPVPGIVVPDINVPSSVAGESGYLDLHNAHLAGLAEIMDWFRDVGNPANQPSPSIPISELPTVIDAVTGGGAASTPAPAGAVAVAPPPSAPGPKPCCLYNGHPLSWWKRKQDGTFRHGKWKWPGTGFIHTRSFDGNRACDGGGSAPGSKREC